MEKERSSELLAWENCLNFIKDNISTQTFKTWFEPIKPIKIEGSVLTLEVPSKFFYEWLEEHYMKLLKIAITKELGKNARLVYSIVIDKNSKTKETKTLNIPSVNGGKKKNFEQSYSSFQNFKEDKVLNPFVIPGLKKIEIDPQLNRNYTFNTFIEGTSNKLARTAGLAIAKKPGGTSFNPMFIHGGVGLGKTHLAHAIGSKVKENHPKKVVLYVAAERFIQQYVESVRSNNRNDFIHFYQMIDVLIVDDIQFFSGKKGTQEVFFQIFNHLHQNGKQIILTSDKPPVEMKDVEQRLLSRFKWGLSAELQRPDYEIRYNILKSKLEKDGIELSENIIEYVAQSVKTNFRELEGVIISLVAQASFSQKEITFELAQKTVSNYVKQTKKEITIDYIQKTVCSYFDLSEDLIQSKTRKREVVQARQLAMYFSKMLTKNSLAKIGKEIGNRDHATVLHACKTVNNLNETDKTFKNYFEEIKNQLVVS